MAPRAVVNVLGGKCTSVRAVGNRTPTHSVRGLVVTRAAASSYSSQYIILPFGMYGCETWFLFFVLRNEHRQCKIDSAHIKTDLKRTSFVILRQ
jgi:hypothetical protein